MRRHGAICALVLVGAACGGCGTSARPAEPISSWLAFHPGTKTVSLRLLAAYNGAYDGFNFNGYGKGEVLVEVPQRWRVDVHCVNDSDSMRHSCAIVRALSAAPAFAGASSHEARAGLRPGQAATFTFVATRRGTYRIVCLVPGHEQEGMWDVLDVTRRRLPAVVLLRRPP